MSIDQATSRRTFLKEVGAAAAIRSRSTTPADASAQLVYGVTNVRTKEHFSGYLPSGTLTETTDRMETTFVANGKMLLRCAQTDDALSQFDVSLRLPLPQSEFRFSQFASPSSVTLMFDPDDPHRIVGSGMLEQTHDEAGDHRIFMPFITK